MSVTEVRLVAALAMPGACTVELWAWDAANNFFPLHVFVEILSDEAVLSARFEQPVVDIVRLRVASTAAPAQVGWREIGVLDR